MKHNPFLRSTPNKKRKEHRRVRGRQALHGQEKTNLRLLVFRRSKGMCELKLANCEGEIFWTAFHLSHNRHGARKDDSLEGCKAACPPCHRDYHNAGGKPVKRKLGRLMRRNEAIPYLKSQQCVCGRPKKQDSPFCEGCQSVISPQSKLNLETLTGREWLKGMQDAEQEVLAAIAEGRYS